jgi:transcriptional adapter 2-alpha
MVEVYNDRLRERAHRRRVVREHGLLMPHKTYASMSRYSSTLGRSLLESLAPFAQLLTGLQFDYFLEGKMWLILY